MLIPIKESSFSVVYDGYGDVTYKNNLLKYWPKTSTKPNETHATLVLIKQTINQGYKNFNLKFTAKVEKQLRLNSPANTWETMWVLFNFVGDGGEDESGNYFCHKTNGCEMGSFINMDQEYYATNNLMPCKIGQYYNYEVIKDDHIFSFKINNKIVIKYPTYIMDQTPLNDLGSIGFYCEDAKIVVKNIDFSGILEA